jgi:hypothetical protein
MYKPMMVEGRWIMPGDGRVVVMNKTTAEDENIQLGDTITLDLGELGKDEWRVVGFYRVFLMFGGGFSVDPLYAPREAVFEATQKAGRGTTLLVRTQSHTASDVESVAASLSDLLKQRNISISQTETMPALRKTWDISFAIVVNMLLALSWIVALVGGVGLMGALSISVLERTKEIGVMRAIGAQSYTVMGMFLLEGTVQGILSWLIAVPIAYLVTPFLSGAMGMAMFKSALDYQFNLRAVFIWLAAVLAISAYPPFYLRATPPALTCASACITNNPPLCRSNSPFSAQPGLRRPRPTGFCLWPGKDPALAPGFPAPGRGGCSHQSISSALLSWYTIPGGPGSPYHPRRYRSPGVVPVKPAITRPEAIPSQY